MFNLKILTEIKSLLGIRGQEETENTKLIATKSN